MQQKKRQKIHTNIIQSIIRYKQSTDIKQKTLILLKLKQQLLRDNNLDKYQCTTFKNLLFNKLKNGFQRNQQKIFLHISAIFIKHQLTTQQFDNIHDFIINLLQQQKNSLKRCIQFLIEILQIFQSQQPYKYQRYFINHILNSFLTLGNILIKRCIINDYNYNNQEVLAIVSSQDVLQVILKFLHKTFVYDFQGSCRGQQTDQFIWQKSPILIPTKYSRFSKFQQFEEWLKKQGTIDLYQFIYFSVKNTNIKVTIVNLLGDLSRVHFRFFRNQNNYKIHLTNIIHAFISILSGLTIKNQYQYNIALEIGINLNKLFTSNLLFKIDQHIRQNLFNNLSRFLREEICQKSIITQSLIGQYFGFMVKMANKTKYQKNQNIQEDIQVLVREVGKFYQDSLEGPLVESLMDSKNLNNTFFQCLEDPRPETLQIYLNFFKIYKPKSHSRSYLSYCFQFQYWFYQYLRKQQQNYLYTQSLRNLLQIFNQICQQNYNKLKVIIEYINYHLLETQIQISLFFKDIQFNYFKYLEIIIHKQYQKQFVFVYHTIKSNCQKFNLINEDIYHFKQIILSSINSKHFKQESIIKLYQIYGLLITDKQLQTNKELSPYFLLACLKNKRQNKYLNRVKQIYNKLFQIVIKSGYLLQQSQTNLKLLPSLQIFLEESSSQSDIQKYPTLKNIAPYLYSALKKILQGPKYVHSLIEFEGSAINCLSILLKWSYSSKYILLELKDQKFISLIQICKQVFSSISPKDIIYNTILQDNFLQLIQCIYHCYYQQLYKWNINKIFNFWEILGKKYQSLLNLFSQSIELFDEDIICKLICHINDQLIISIQNIWIYFDLIKVLYKNYPFKCQAIINRPHILNCFIWILNLSAQEVSWKIQEYNQVIEESNNKSEHLSEFQDSQNQSIEPSLSQKYLDFNTNDYL